MFGGIVGRVWEKSSDNVSFIIKQCYNNAKGNGIYGKYAQVGGIIGTSGCSITEDCYNMSKVLSETSEVGGICGGQWGGTLRNVYNKGTVIGGERAIGGITGGLGYTTANNFINIGNISGETDVGEIAGVWFRDTNNQDTNTWENGSWFETTSLTEEDMKKWTEGQIKGYLGDNFTKDTKGINGGLPILTWQAK